MSTGALKVGSAFSLMVVVECFLLLIARWVGCNQDAFITAAGFHFSPPRKRK